MIRTLSVFAAIAGLTAVRADDKKPPADAPYTDADFVAMAASGNMLEVKVGELVVAKTKTEAVKKHAQQMIADHTKANAELAKVAEKAGMALPAKLAPEHQKCLDKFAGESADLDKLYIEENVKGHEMAAAAYKRATAEAKDPGVKEYAAKTLPVIQEHLEMLKKMKVSDK